jgi:hypothetical protein
MLPKNLSKMRHYARFMKFPVLLVAAACLIVSTVSIAEAKEFETDAYSVEVPNACKTEDEPNRFSSDAFFECSNMDEAEGNIAFEMADSPYTGTDEELPDQLLGVITDKWGSNVEEVERGTDKYVLNNQTAPFIIATFEQEFTGLFGLPTKTEDWVYMVVGIK